MIRLHSAETGIEIYFNPQHIIGCMKLPDGSTSIQLSTEDRQDVQESPQAVALAVREYHIEMAAAINRRIHY